MSEVALPSTARLGQATAIEQSRAIAEVQAAIVVAQQCPRDVQAAMRQMRESCQMKAVADRAFFRFSRAGSTVSGSSVHLARELARCWGNIQYGVSELSRDDEHGQSEMQAFAWDVQTNTRAAAIFIVPHKRDKKGGAVEITDMRDIYENNANNGARRVREAIFAVLPPWFKEEAVELCTKTLIDGGGIPLPKRIADAIGAYSTIGVSEDDIVRKLGKPSAKWSAVEVAQLGVTYRSIQRGEVQREEEFPAPVVTAEEITARGNSARPARRGGVDAAGLAAELAGLGLDAAYQVAVVQAFTGRPDEIDPADLSNAEARTVLAKVRAAIGDRTGDDALLALDAAVSHAVEEAAR